jgi:hypothetical protein
MSTVTPVITCCFNPKIMWSIDELVSLHLFHDLYKTFAIPVGTSYKKEGQNPIVSIRINGIIKILYQGNEFEKDNGIMLDKFDIWMSFLKRLQHFISTKNAENFINLINQNSLVDFVDNKSVELIQEAI